MVKRSSDKYSAGEQGLGYIYQPRFALLQLLQQPEDTAVFIEKDDDLDFLVEGGGKSLGSLKHKAVGDRLTDLSLDFWKSVRIWLTRYRNHGLSASNLQFYLFTTGMVSDNSFLKGFLPAQFNIVSDSSPLSQLAESALARSESKSIRMISKELEKLTSAEKEDFFSRIVILDCSPRIEDIPSIIKNKHLRTIRREHRDFVFERLEGWWNEIIIQQLTGNRSEGIYGYEVSDKLSAIAEEYKSNNLPITFRGKMPDEEIDAENDSRLFVAQLREIGISPSRIRSAILDYYRAFEQRSAWARESLLISGEIEDYEDRLADEWSRYKDVVFDCLDESSADDLLRQAGKELYKWAEMESVELESLRIRMHVTEPYVTRGGFHILANATPKPRVYWHPRFLERLGNLLGVCK